MSSLLFDKDDILLVNRRLAAIVGLNEAIVLQQIDYWVKKKRGGVEHQGCRWVFNSLDSWHAQFPFWSKDTVKRALAALKTRGLIRVQKLAEAARDQTNYYTVDYKAVTLLEASNLHPSIGANCTDGEAQIAPMGKGNLHQSEGADCTDANRTKTTSKTTTDIVATPTRKRATVVPKKSAKPKREPKPKPEPKEDQEPLPPMVITAANGTIYEIPGDLRYPKEGSKTHRTWVAYAIVYHRRYKVWPIWNGQVGGQIANFIEQVGEGRAPAIAWHYVRHVEEDFVAKLMHPVKLLKSDAQKWATQCENGANGETARGNQVDQNTPVETYAQRAARQRVEEVTPLAARKVPGAPNPIELLNALVQSGQVKLGAAAGPVVGEGDEHAPR